jgi:hypothetical protein
MGGQMDAEANDFYEDDEPIAKLVGIFEAGEKGLTGPVVRGWNHSITFDFEVSSRSNETRAARAS